MVSNEANSIQLNLDASFLQHERHFASIGNSKGFQMDISCFLFQFVGHTIGTNALEQRFISHSAEMSIKIK